MITQNIEEYNYSVKRGDDFELAVILSDTLGNPVDITGWTIYFTAKKNETDSDNSAVISITETPTDPTNGKAELTIPHTTTYNLLGTYYYDVRFVNLSGIVNTVASGGITFLIDTTRRVFS